MCVTIVYSRLYFYSFCMFNFCVCIKHTNLTKYLCTLRSRLVGSKYMENDKALLPTAKLHLWKVISFIFLPVVQYNFFSHSSRYRRYRIISVFQDKTRETGKNLILFFKKCFLFCLLLYLSLTLKLCETWWNNLLKDVLILMHSLGFACFLQEIVNVVFTFIIIKSTTQ